MTFLLALLLAGNVWTVEPGQSLVTVVRGRQWATSLGLTGHLTEREDGAVTAEVRLREASFDGALDPRAEIVFEGVAAAPGKDGVLHLKGTLTVRGVARPLEVPLTLVRARGQVFCHASFAVEGARVDVDAGLQPEAVASRG